MSPNCLTAKLTMKLTKSTRAFLNVFYFLGQSPYSVDLNLSPRNIIWTQIPGYSISFIYFAAATESFYGLLVNGKKDGFGTTDTVISQFNNICDIFRAYCLFRQCYYDRKLMFEIMQTFANLEATFANNLDFQLRYRRFCRGFLLKTVLFVSVYLSSVLTPLIQFMRTKRFNAVMLRVKLLQIMYIIGIVHIVFNVDLVRHFMKQLNAVLERDVGIARDINLNAKQRNANIHSRLKCYKMIYYRLWLTVQYMNRYFGWNILSIILRSFVHIVFTLYWQIGIFKKAHGILQIVRMYILSQD